MQLPRFLFMGSAVPAAPRRSGAGRYHQDPPGGTEYLWRLVAGNNRQLGRSPGTYTDLAECRAGVDRLVEALPQLVPVLAPGSSAGAWAWHLVLPGVEGERSVLAVSSRSFERQRENRYSIESFREAARVAVVSDSVVLRSRPRPAARFAVETALVPCQPVGRGARSQRGVAGVTGGGWNASQPRSDAPAGAGSPLPPE